jgi:acetolactate synthase-1/2/3 large subunit
MESKSGAELLVECLDNEDVEYIFGLPGEQTIPIMEEIRKSDIDFITVRHEQGAAFMADIYSRVSDKIGVCIATLGPGATNLVTGIGNASLDHSSVVAITSQRGVSDQHKHTHQFVNTNSVFEAVTKQTEQISRANTIPEQVRKAFEVAKRQKKGATHLEFPSDLSNSEVKKDPIDNADNRVSPNGVQDVNIESALDIIEESTNPIIISGQEVISQNASDELTKFAEESGIPVVTTFMGKGGISYRHGKHIGTIGFSSDDYAMDSVKQADTVITIGYDYIEYHPESWNIGEEKNIIHIDTIPPEIDEKYGVEMTLIGHISRILRQFIKHTEQVCDKKYAKKLRQSYQESMSEEYEENAQPPFTPQQVIKSIRDVLGDSDILISDVGSHKYWLSRRYPTYEPGTFIVSNGFASMGVALPGSIAASIHSDNKVVAVTGDGGFLMNSQEIETAKRLGVNPTIIVLEDNEYTAISMEQQEKYGQDYGSSFENPDFQKLAESFDAYGDKITKSGEMDSKIQKAVDKNDISILSVPIDPEESYILEKNMK